jgi:thiamine-monophosphate kinase
MKDEAALTGWLRRAAHIPPHSQLVRGIGDDCAIFRPKNSPDDLLFTTDLLIEDVHFTGRNYSPAQAGRKALARSLSDIAAMGGEPRFCLVSLAVTEQAFGQNRSRWVPAFFRGLLKLAEETGTILAGGDLSHARKVVCDVMVAGGVPRGQALRRDGARPGDEIYVSGRLGGSALGLSTRRGKAWRCHLRPEPRLALGRFARQKLRATAAIDLSDGLSLDLRRLALESRLAAEISLPPLFPGATFAGATAEQALHGGEDYELLFTVPPRTHVPAEFEGLAITRIGAMRSGKTGQVLLDGNELRAAGYDHFNRAW